MIVVDGVDIVQAFAVGLLVNVWSFRVAYQRVAEVVVAVAAHASAAEQ